MFPVDDGAREGGKLLRVAERVPCSGEDRYSWESRPHLRARCLFYAIAFGDIEEPAAFLSGTSCAQLRSLCESMVETLPTARRPEVRWQVLWLQLMIFVGNPFQEQTTDCANGSWQHQGHVPTWKTMRWKSLGAWVNLCAFWQGSVTNHVDLMRVFNVLVQGPLKEYKAAVSAKDNI